MIPTLLHSVANGFLVGRGGFRPSDLCVSAPTGSGKTLAFVIPVVQVRVFTCCTHPNPCLSPARKDPVLCPDHFFPLLPSLSCRHCLAGLYAAFVPW